jgi:hypothetical protein
MWVCICMSSLAHKSEITHPRGGSSSRSPEVFITSSERSEIHIGLMGPQLGLELPL